MLTAPNIISSEKNCKLFNIDSKWSIIKHDRHHLRFYNPDDYNVCKDPPQTMINIINRLNENFLNKKNKRFLPHLRKSRSDLRETCCLVLGWFSHHLKLDTFNGDIETRTTFTISQVAAAIGRSWSGVQRAIALLIDRGYIARGSRKYIKDTIFYASLYQLKAKLFNHLRFKFSTLRKSADNAKKVQEHKDVQKRSGIKMPPLKEITKTDCMAAINQILKPKPSR